MESQKLDAKTTTADSTNTNILSKVADKIKGHKGLVAGGAAVLVAGAIAVASLTAQADPTGWVKVTGTNYEEYPVYAYEDEDNPVYTEAGADDPTVMDYVNYPTGNQGTSYETTEYAGRLWVDKTVYTPDYTSDGFLDTTQVVPLAHRDYDMGEKLNPAGQFEVDKTASGTFLTAISLLSSSLETVSNDPVPLDIVLVLDRSGSMKDPVGESHTEERYLSNEEISSRLTMGAKGLSGFSFIKYDGNKRTGKNQFEGYVRIAHGSYDDTGNFQYEYDANGDVVYDKVPFIADKQDSDPKKCYYLFVTDPDQCTTTPEKKRVRFQSGEFVDAYGTVGSTTNPKTQPTQGDTNEYEDWDFYYTVLIETVTVSRTRMDDLHDAVNEFIDGIAENNSKVEAAGYSEDYMSRIGIVKFSGKAKSGSTSWTPTDDEDIYTMMDLNNIENDNNSQIMSPFEIYTSGSDATASIKAHVNEITAYGGTAANIGLQLARGLIDGRAHYTGEEPEDGARQGVKTVVVFFTDGNPKHDGGTSPKDFQGKAAQYTLAQAKQLKGAGITVYSVAVVEGANANDMSENINVYLNGVSSNYSDAKAASGTTTSVFGTSYAAHNYNPPEYRSEYYTPSNISWDPDVASWHRNYGYTITADKTVQLGKLYYTKSGTGSNTVYTPVAEPQTEYIGDYYETINYYLVAGDDNQSLTEAFMLILNQITESGGDTSASGRDGSTSVTIVDKLGDYMEFKGLDGMLYGTNADNTIYYAPGTQNAYREFASVQIDNKSANETVYTLIHEVPSSAFGAGSNETTNLDRITIKVHRYNDQKEGDEIEIKVSADLIPSLRYKITKNRQDGGASTVSVERTDADPLRIFYSVGPKASTLSNVISQLEDQALSEPAAINQKDQRTDAYITFGSNAYSDGEGDIYPLYSNKKPEGANPTTGTTTVTMVVSKANPFYFFTEDTPLYIKDGNNYVRANTTNYPGEGETTPQLYARHEVWTVNQPGNDPSYDYVAFTDTAQAAVGTDASPIGKDEENYLYVKSGTPKTDDGYYTSRSFAKGDTANRTETASNYLVTTFNPESAGGQSGDNATATMYLGNNGKLKIPIYGTLAITKEFVAGTGLSVPDDAEATFTLTLMDANGEALTGTYRALIRDSEGYPINPSTHARVSSAASVTFDMRSGQSFELRDNETLRITGIPNGTTYTVTEAAQDGYQATVTSSNGSWQTFDRGEASNTQPAQTTQNSGTTGD